MDWESPISIYVERSKCKQMFKRNVVLGLIMALLVVSLAPGLSFAQESWPPLKIEMTASAEAEVITYAITLKNEADWNMQDVIVKGLLPLGATLVSVEAPSPIEAVFDGSDASFSILELPAGTTVGPLIYKVNAVGVTEEAAFAHAWVSWKGQVAGSVLSPEVVVSLTPVEEKPAEEAPAPMKEALPEEKAAEEPSEEEEVKGIAIGEALPGKLVFQVSSGGFIYLIDADGSGLTLLTDGLDPALSPDGSQVAFTRWRDERGLYVINVDGSGERMLYGTSQAKAPAWSPDGTKIAFTHQKGGRLDLIKKGQTYPDSDGVVMPDKDDQKRKEAQEDIPPNPWWKLARVNTVYTGDEGGKESYFLDLPCRHFSFSPTWSPDNNIIAYRSDLGIRLSSEDHSVDQSSPEPNQGLSADNMDGSPAWSPDGTRLAFMSRHGEFYHISVMGPDGGGRAQLTEGMYHDVAPTWSPDSQYIAFLTNRNGPWEIYVMRADGSEERKMFDLDDLKIVYDFVDERVISWSQ